MNLVQEFIQSHYGIVSTGFKPDSDEFDITADEYGAAQADLRRIKEAKAHIPAATKASLKAIMESLNFASKNDEEALESVCGAITDALADFFYTSKQAAELIAREYEDSQPNPNDEHRTY